MAADIRIVTVKERSTRQWFVDVPFAIHKDDRQWVPMLRSSMADIVSPGKNPFYREAEIENFVAVGDKDCLMGRISVCIHHDYNARFGQNRAFFGFFESVNHQCVASALLHAAENWAIQRGKDLLLGPYSYTTTQEAALLLESLDDSRPTFLQSYNPSYYRDLLERHGYELAFTFSTYGANVVQDKDYLSRIMAKSSRVRNRLNITVRKATKQDAKSNFEEIRTLFNDAFSNNYEVSAISADVFRFQIEAVKYFIDLDGVRIIEVNGKPEAFFVILPDLNEILSELNGSLSLLNLLRMPWLKRKIERCVIALIGANPDWHGGGLGRVIAEEIALYARKKYQEVHTMWIDDRNPSSYVLAKNAYMKKTKRYGVFSRVLDENEPRGGSNAYA